MAIKVECSNPQCRAAFQVKDELAGKKVRCPRCGNVIQVPESPAVAAPGLGPDMSAGAEQEGVRFHPARQQCPNCGAILGVRVKYCPKCGADIRTGGIRDEKAEKHMNLGPLVAAGVAIVVLAAIVIGVLLVVKNWSSIAGGGEEVAEEAEGPAEVPQEGQVRKGAPGRPRAASAVTEEELAAISAEQKQLMDAVKAFRERLQALLSKTATSTAEDMAKGWADLYSFCEQSGLKKEADSCWFRAVRLRPRDTATNEVLGRTEQFMGQPVTPAQKEFLEGLRPAVEVANYRVGPQALQVAVGSSGVKDVPQGRSVQFRADGGATALKVTPQGGGKGAEMAFELNALPGFHYTVEIRDPSAAPALPLAELGLLFQALEAWGKCEQADGTLDEAKAVAAGWQKTLDGWQVAAKKKQQPVRFRVSDSNKLLEASVGALSLSGTSEGRPRLQRPGRNAPVYVQGILAVSSEIEGRKEKHVYFGGKAHPAMVNIDIQANRAELRSGAYYVLKEDLAPSLWNILATINSDIALRRAESELAAQEELFRREVRAQEAEGKLSGPWQAEALIEDKMSEARRHVQQELDYQRRAAEMPDSLDRVEALGIGDRAAHLYLNWPRYRVALASLLGPSADGIMEEVRLAARSRKPAAGVGVPDLAGLQGPGYVPPDAAKYMPRGAAAPPPPGGMPGPGFGVPGMGTGPAGEGAQELDILGLFPDDVVLSRIESLWVGLDQQSWRSAIAALQKIGTPRAVELLGSLSGQSSDENVVIPALLALSSIGTAEALEYCKAPAVLARLQVAQVAALALAGDPETLQSLPEFVASSDPQGRDLLLGLATQSDSPAAVLVLAKIIDTYPAGTSKAQPARRGRFARRPTPAAPSAAWQAKAASGLVRLGGHSSMYELARLARKGLPITTEMLEKIAPDELTFLAQALGQAVRKGGEESEKVAVFLARSGVESALAQLKAAAAAGNRQALIGLAAAGSRPLLKEASEMCAQVNLDAMKRIRAYWRAPDAEEGVWAWRKGVDEQAAEGFLNAVLLKSSSERARLAAARMLLETGQTPDRKALVSIALAPPTAAPAKEEKMPTGPSIPGLGPPPEMAPPPGMGLGVAGMPGMPVGPQELDPYPGVIAETRAEQGPTGPLEFPGDAKVHALKMLMEIGGGQISEELKGLVESSEDIKVKVLALTALARVAGRQEQDYFREKATSVKKSFSDRADLEKDVMVRAGAAQALGIAGDAQIAPKLAAMLQESPPPASAISDEAERAEYGVLAAWWQVILQTGVCQAFAEMCESKDLRELVDDDLRTRLVSSFARLVAQPGRDAPGMGMARAGLRIAALRAFARSGGAFESSGLILLNRLAIQLGWSGPTGGRGIGQVMPGPGPGMVPGPGPGATGPPLGIVAPGEARLPGDRG